MSDDTGTDDAPAVQSPPLGAAVHYVLPEGSPKAGKHRAATVVGGIDGLANLFVFAGYDGDFGLFNTELVKRVMDVKHCPDGTMGTWHEAEENPDHSLHC